MSSGSGFISRGHGSIARFTLSRPTDAQAAAARLAAGARCHAGGVDLVGRLRNGEAVPELVSVSNIERLRTIQESAGRLSIGAAVTHFEIENSPVVAAHRPDLAQAWRTIGNARIRRTGTIGGNLLAFDRTYDAAPILAASAARLIWLDKDGAITTTNVVQRHRSDLLLRVEVPTRGRIVFDRSLKPMVSVALGEETVAVGCAHDDVVVRPRPIGDDIRSWVLSMVEPTNDAVASAAYRRKMIGVLVTRLAERHGRWAS